MKFLARVKYLPPPWVYPTAGRHGLLNQGAENEREERVRDDGNESRARAAVLGVKNRERESLLYHLPKISEFG